MIYPEHIARCQHIKTNGTQCGSPALKKKRFCYFHQRWRDQTVVIERQRVTLPLLEDADAIQVALMEVLRLLLTGKIDQKRAALMLYGLQIASANLKKTTLEPDVPTRVVIDPKATAELPIGATAWSSAGEDEYDDLEHVLWDRKFREKHSEEEYVGNQSGESLAKTLLDRLGLPEKPYHEPQPV